MFNSFSDTTEVGGGIYTNKKTWMRSFQRWFESDWDELHMSGKKDRDVEAGKRDYLHLAFDRLAIGINTIGSGTDQ